MKKIKNIFFVFAVVMFLSIVNVDAASVSIKSVKLVDSKGNATEVSEAVPNGLDIKFDLSFSDVGDSATYEVVLNNPTNKEYEINTDKQFSKSNYISYSYELKDKTNRVKANSEVTVFITIKYENPVPTSSLVDGKYVENNTMGINLLNEDNPSTANNIIFLMLILLGVIGFTFLSKNIKNKEYLIIFVALLLVPVTVFALEKLKLTVSTKITIAEKYIVYYDLGNYMKTSDLNKPNIVSSNCEDNIRILNEDGEYENYSQCMILLQKDKSYMPGERVVLNELPKYLSINYDRCDDPDSNNITICQNNAPSELNNDCPTFTCGLTREISNNYNWECTQEEFYGMNFDSDNSYPSWDGHFGKVSLNIPNSFTMPRHDVVINVDACR